MNSSQITGRLVKDPELRATQSGKNVTSFTVAVDDPYIKDSTDFIDCVAWEKKAEFVCNYFKKGSRIEVTGRMKTRLIEKDGVKTKRTELVSDTVGFGDSKKSEESGAPAPEENNTQNHQYSGDDFQQVDDEDLPF